MTLLTTAEFRFIGFPDDQVENADKIVEPAGRNIAETIANLLQERGMEISTPTLNEEHYGWEFFANTSKGKFWVQVTALEDVCILGTEDATSPLRFLFPNRSAFASFLRSLHSALTAEQRFHSIQWYPRVRQPWHAGTAHPTDSQ